MFSQLVSDIIIEFNNSKSPVLDEIKKGLTEVRSGPQTWKQKHETHKGGLTKKLKFSRPNRTADGIDFEIKNDVGVWLDDTIDDEQKRRVWKELFKKGPSSGKRSPYITNLIKWVSKKYGLRGKDALRAAFRVANSHIKSQSFVQNPGWFNEVKPKADKMMFKAMEKVAGPGIDKLVKKELGLKITTKISL